MSPRETEGFRGNPEEAGEEESKPQAESLDLAKATGTVAAGLATAEKMEGQDIKRQRLERDPNFSHHLYNKVDFTDDEKSLNASVKEFIENFIILQNQILNYVPVRARAGAGVKAENIVIDPRVEETRRKQWELLKKFLGLSGSYTLIDLDYALAYELPKRLADYRVLAKTYVQRVMNLQEGVILETGVVSGFFHVDDVASDEVDVDETRLKRDVLSISPLATRTNQLFVEKVDAGYSAQHLYQNVILDARYKKSQEESIKNAQADNKRYANQSHADFLADIAKSNTPRYRAGFLATTKILNKNSFEALSSQITPQELAHETGHLYFASAFLKAFSPPRTNRVRDLLVHDANLFVHDETTAILSGLQQERSQAFSLLKLFSYLREGVQGDFAHDETANWIIDRFVNLIKTNPQMYGIEVDGKRPVSVDNQIILQLPVLLEKPELTAKLVGEIIQIHQNNLQQDFSAKYFQFQGLPVPPDLPNVPLVEPQAEEKKEFPWVETGVGVAVGAGLTAAGIGLNRLRKRKQMVQAENQLLGSLRSFRGERINPNKIISDLQLGAKRSAVDAQARARALADLTRLGQKDKKIAGAADYLRRKLGVENQDKVNEKGKREKK